jgi:hypothetical protein
MSALGSQRPFLFLCFVYFVHFGSLADIRIAIAMFGLPQH